MKNVTKLMPVFLPPKTVQPSQNFTQEEFDELEIESKIDFYLDRLMSEYNLDNSRNKTRTGYKRVFNASAPKKSSINWHNSDLFN